MGVMNVVDIWTPIGHDQNVHHNIFEIGDGAVGGESSRYLLWFSMESIGSHPLIHTMKYFWISPYRLLLARELH